MAFDGGLRTREEVGIMVGKLWGKGGARTGIFALKSVWTKNEVLRERCITSEQRFS